MYAVIFRAKVKCLDELYSEMAQRMRELALSEYGCIDFVSSCEGDNELAISYWKSKEDIHAWKQNQEHLRAQALGKERWYECYSVEVVEVLHKYTS